MSVGKNVKIMVKSAVVSLFVFSLALSAVYFMGAAYSEMEMTVSGKKTEFFTVTENGIDFFGRSYEFNVKGIWDGIKNAAGFLSGGIVKIVAIVANGMGEITDLIKSFR